MQSSRQSFQAARLLGYCQDTHKPMITLRGLFHIKEKEAWGQRPEPRPWISVLQAIIRGSQVKLPFFLTITLDQRMCPSSLHFGTLHTGDPRGQGWLLTEQSYLCDQNCLWEGVMFQGKQGWKLDSLEVLGSLKFPFQENPTLSPKLQEKKQAS